MKPMRIAVLLIAAFAATLAFTDSVIAKDKTITVMVIQNGKTLVTEVASTKELSDEFMLDPGETNRGQLRRGALQMTIDGLTNNMRSRIKNHEDGDPLSPLQEAALSRTIMYKTGGCTSSCFKAYRAGDGDVICAGDCRDCQVETCTP